MKNKLKKMTWLVRLVHYTRWAKSGYISRFSSTHWIGYRFRKSSIKKKYRKLLEGKNVAVVGPAPYLDDLGLGRYIDDHDVVVRLNVALPIKPSAAEDIGLKTDILYHALSEKNGRDISTLVDLWNLQFICSSYPNCRWYTKLNIDFLKKKVRTPFRIVDIHIFRHLRSMLEGTPNTGMMAITDILNCRIKSLSVIGFSFEDRVYSQKSRASSDPSKSDCKDASNSFSLLKEIMHAQDEQLNLFTEMYHADKRIKPDEKLLSIMESRFNDPNLSSN